MQLFHIIDDAECILLSRGVYKQSPVYRRGDRVFAKHAGGFVRICAKFGDSWGTSVANVKVVDISQNVPGLFVGNDGKREPRCTL